ncbi:MAG TPA: GIY-YIG nuclease family protein [Thermoanaerobaculia bacterium]|nr:GIY-YIG nuclease family protein [Thermoanaerobaculia bacterium]
MIHRSGRRLEPMGYVYVLRSGESNLFKVGKAINVDRRGKELATGNPEPLILFDTIESEHASKSEAFLKERLRLRRSHRSAAKEFYECDVDELITAIEATREYERVVLARAGEVEQLSRQQSDGRILEPGARERELSTLLVAARQAEDDAKRERERWELELKLVIGTASGLEGLATWKTESFRELDEKALKQAEPEIYERFLREKPRRTLRLL